MSDETKNETVAAPESANTLPAHEGGIDTEVKDAETASNANGLAASEVVEESTATNLKGT